MKEVESQAGREALYMNRDERFEDFHVTDFGVENRESV